MSFVTSANLVNTDTRGRVQSLREVSQCPRDLPSDSNLARSQPVHPFDCVSLIRFSTDKVITITEATLPTTAPGAQDARHSAAIHFELVADVSPSIVPSFPCVLHIDFDSVFNNTCHFSIRFDGSNQPATATTNQFTNCRFSK